MTKNSQKTQEYNSQCPVASLWLGSKILEIFNLKIFVLIEKIAFFLWEKFVFLEKLPKNPQKVLGYKSQHPDSINITCLWSRNKILEISGFFFVGDSGKIVRIFEEIKPKATSKVRNMQKKNL